MLALVLLASPAGAAERIVRPGDDLAATVAAAAPGDLLRVRGGVHAGPLVVDRRLRLVGEGRPVIDGGGRGTVVKITAPGVEISGFHVTDSGESLDQENSGIAVEAPSAVVEDNHLEEVLFGIYLKNAPGSTVSGNLVRGKSLDLPRRGDAIRVWYSDGVTLADNEVEASRDVVLWYSEDLRVRGNRVRDGRYGLHFMYCDDATIEGNLLLDNSVGAFLMYSRRLRLVGNTVAGNHGPSGYGVGLKDMDDAEVRANLFAGNRVAMFLDNSPREVDSHSLIDGNLLAANDIGVLLLPNVRRARFTGNGFAENGEQVSIAGGGGSPEANLWQHNHWSDYRGYDADDDGFGDLPYRAQRLFENLADRHPALRLFSGSPVAQALDFAARAFPVVRPQPKLVDPEPRMEPVELASAPPLPRPERSPLAPAAGALVAAGLLIFGLPRLVENGRRGATAGGSDRGTSEETRGENPPATVLIEARELSKRFGDTRALAGVSFTITAGEAVALSGPNGAGKTTALRAILGVLPFEGRLTVAGHDPWKEGKAARRHLGFVPQEMAFQGDLGVDETLLFFARLRRIGRERVEELLPELGLDEHRDKRVQELSGGLKQRLALGVALLADPPILLLDEPTANLDREARAGFLEYLGRLRQGGKTLVFSSHRNEEIAALADRVLHLDEGRLAHDLPTSDPAALPAVELRLLVPEADRDRAAALLEQEGFGPRRLGPYLAVQVAALGKVEPLARLVAAGIAVEDFGLPESGRSQEGDHAQPA